MKTTLFCKKPYAFGILKPLHDELIKRNHQVKWFISGDIMDKFPFKNDCDFTPSIQEIHGFSNDVIFVPGNEVPHYLRGVKVQIFHGFAGEKKSHFKMRKYFDLYLTQGSYFTERFKALAKKYKDFDVIETGWPKLDQLFPKKNSYRIEKQELLNKHQVKRIILYAPTCQRSLTSAGVLKDHIFQLADSENLLLIKFHDLLNKEIIAEYENLSKEKSNVKIINDHNIIKYLILSDLMISDTSSVVYEFLLLDKPVITFKSISKNIKWENFTDPDQLILKVNETLKYDRFKADRKWFIENYHPFTDGWSSKRIVDTMEEYIKNHPVPSFRKIPWRRRRKMVKIFGNIN